MKLLLTLCFSVIFIPLVSHDFEVIVLGEAIIDHTAFIQEDFLKDVPGEKGEWMPVSNDSFNNILKHISGTKKTLPGGSGANTAKGLAGLGLKTAILGPIGADDYANKYVDNLQTLGVSSFFAKTIDKTCEIICMVTPDCERTMRCNGDMRYSMNATDIQEEIFENISLLHIEGYMLPYHDVILKVLKLAKSQNALVSLNLGNTHLINTERDFIEKALQSSDIVICNEGEAEFFTHKKGKEALIALSKMVKVVVVTKGEQGLWIAKNESYYYQPAFVSKTLDTTGAGDLFMSGFLFSYLKGDSLKDNARLGAYVASIVVEELGGEIAYEKWNSIKNMIWDKKNHNLFE